jgi:ATPase subunit of ABC transporter with duplicated ATPase domains
MIAVSGLSKHFGPQTLFEDVAFQLTPGNRYGLVGANGSGKSTLLKIIAGREPASDGTVAIPKRLTVGYLEQDHFQYEDTPILEVAMMGDHEVWQAMREKDEILDRAHEEFDGDRYAELEDLILTRDGYALEARAGEVLEGLGIPSEVHRQPLSTLSGGFKLRVLLAKVLAAKPDALLLDEPTNHLDIVSIRWLEKFLQGYDGIAVVVSHDHRYGPAFGRRVRHRGSGRGGRGRVASPRRASPARPHRPRNRAPSRCATHTRQRRTGSR